MKLFRRLWRDESGTTSVEYCVLLTLIVLGMMGGAAMFGDGQAFGWGGVRGRMQAIGL